MVKRAVSPAKQFASGLQQKLKGIVTAVVSPVKKVQGAVKDYKQMKAAYKDYQTLQKTQQVQGRGTNGDLKAQYAQYINSGKNPTVATGAVPKPAAPSAPSVAVPKSPTVQNVAGAQSIQKAPAVTPTTKA
jgi:hypothetical protein